MKASILFRAMGMAAACATGAVLLAAGGDKPAPSGKAAPASKPGPAAPEGKDGVRFTVRCLMIDRNEGCAIADVNRDGRPDAIAGRNWYPAPDFIPRPLRTIEDWRIYAQTTGDHVWDVNGDGWPDVICGYWYEKEVHWFENPKAEGLKRGHLWTRHLLATTSAAKNEIFYLRDLDGDGTPEWVVNPMGPKEPMRVWKLARDAKGEPTLKEFTLGANGGHGIGFGDLNGDGREDILLGTGWYERPKGDIFSQPWPFHPDWNWHASCPMLVRDLDGDGRNDIIRGEGHNYGLFWMRQEAPAADGKLRFAEQAIDRSWSQPHCLAWADLDGDGQDELITGKRLFAHGDKDPGSLEPPCLYYYRWDRKALTFYRHAIDVGTVGAGLQIAAGDLNGDGRTDILVSGQAGTYILFNQGR